MDTTDTTQTPDQLLVDLSELHTRTIVSPQPKHPAAMGWQATAGSMAAGFARALHALNEVAPDKAAEITDWFQGPFGEGPDPEEHTDWVERTVAKNTAVLEKWIQEAQELAKKAQQATAEREHKELGEDRASTLRKAADFLRDAYADGLTVQEIGTSIRHWADDAEKAAPVETHIVADDSDDPEHVDDCPGCENTTA